MRGGALGSGPTNFSRTKRAASLLQAVEAAAPRRIPAEPRAAGRGGAASLCAGTLTSPQRPRLRGRRGQQLHSGRTCCSLCVLTEAQGRALGDQTRILLRASRSLAWGTPAQVEVGNSTRDPGVRACASWLSPLSHTASQPQRPQLGRIRSLLCGFTPSSVARVRSTRISIAHTSASKTYPENLPRTKVERAIPCDLDAQTGATL